MSNTIGSQKYSEIVLSDSEDTEEELESLDSKMGGSNCCVQHGQHGFVCHADFQPFALVAVNK